jgi:hypothetical protein
MSFLKKYFGKRTPSAEDKLNGDKIVFRTGDSIWLFDIQRNGLTAPSPPRRIVEKTNHQVKGMSASPDRQKIAYDLIEGAWAGAPGSYTIEIVQVSSGQVTSLRPFVPPLRGTERGRVQFNFAGGAFSPDGSLLAFPGSFGFESYGAQLSKPEIAIMDLRREPHIIAAIERPFERLGSYHPRFLSSTHLVHLANFAYEDLLEVCIADISGGVTTIQTKRLTTKADIVWNRPQCFVVADEKAFFVRGHLLFEEEQICYISLNERPPMTIHPVSKEYDKIAELQVSVTTANMIFVAEKRLWVSDLNGQRLRPLVNDDSIGCADGYICSNLAISPDGNHVVFVADNKKDIYVADISTGTAVKLASIETGKPSNPIWL